MLDRPKRDWKTLAQLASQESDPKRLLDLITELNQVLEEQERSNHPSRQPRILIADDEPSIGLTIGPILQQQGFYVRAASSLPEALRNLESETFDILLCDLNFPEPSDGFALIAAMRQARPRSIVMLLTGFPDLDSAIEGIRQKIDDYMVKPIDYDALVAKLKTLMSNQPRLG